MNQLQVNAVQSSSPSSPSQAHLQAQAQYSRPTVFQVPTLPYPSIIPPVSIEQPSVVELEENDVLVSYMHLRGDIYEDEKSHLNRLQSIDKLYQILSKWSVEVAASKSSTTTSDNDSINDTVKDSTILLKIFGSTRLGVHTPDADVDVLCIAPLHITRNDFFSNFCATISDRSDICMISAIPDAYTPVIKFNIDGQAIDMIFVSLALPAVPTDFDVLDNRSLRGLDEQGVRSLNGSRVAECVCRLVPNFSTFCTTLRFVKTWARQRGLYSNVLGFLGGVNYAILVAFVCQRYIRACPSTLIKKFFQTFSLWQWPQPVNITPLIEDRDMKDNDGRYLPVWNPKINIKDGQHVMPIITPAYPSMNSAYNVSNAQFRVIRQEFFRANSICQSSNDGSNDTSISWNKLCEPCTHDFFTSYPKYIQIDISASNPEDHRCWFGWCESRLRLLILALENPPMQLCFPQSNCYHRPDPGVNTDISNSSSSSSDSGNNADSSSSSSRSSSSSSSSSGGNNYLSSFFVGLWFRPDYGSTFNISPSVQDFLYRVNSWEGKKATMGIAVIPRDSHSIPAFVFETKAEPSSIRGCTPAKPSKRVTSDSDRHASTSSSNAVNNNDGGDDDNDDDDSNGLLIKRIINDHTTYCPSPIAAHNVHNNCSSSISSSNSIDTSNNATASTATNKTSTKIPPTVLFPTLPSTGVGFKDDDAVDAYTDLHLKSPVKRGRDTSDSRSNSNE